MAESSKSDLQSSSSIDEAGATPIPLTSESKQSRSFLATARRNLSEEELAAPGVRRFLIDEIERLDARCAELQPFNEKYHDLRVEKAVLDAKLTGSRLTDALSAVCLSAGSAAIGASSKFFEAHVLTGSILLGAAVVLLCAGIVAKVYK
jgi:hypothetical protein